VLYYLNNFYNWLKTNKFTWGISWVFLFFIGLILFLIFRGKFNLGGFLSRKTSDPNKVKIGNTIVEKRKDDTGNIIGIGVPDKQEFVQVEQKKIIPSINPFRDKSVIKTEDGEKIKLPTGVEDKDVDLVLKTKTKEIHVIKLKNDIEHDKKYSKSLDDLISDLEKLDV